MRIPFHLFFLPSQSDLLRDSERNSQPIQSAKSILLHIVPIQAKTAIMSRVQIFESEVVGNEVRDRPTETKGQPARSGLALDRLVLSRPGSIHGPAGAQSESRAGGGGSGGGSGSGRGRSTNDDGRGAARETGGDEPTTPRAEPAVDSRTEGRHAESQRTESPGCTASGNSGRTAPSWWRQHPQHRADDGVRLWWCRAHGPADRSVFPRPRPRRQRPLQ